MLKSYYFNTEIAIKLNIDFLSPQLILIISTIGGLIENNMFDSIKGVNDINYYKIEPSTIKNNSLAFSNYSERQINNLINELIDLNLLTIMKKKNLVFYKVNIKLIKLSISNFERYLK